MSSPLHGGFIGRLVLGSAVVSSIAVVFAGSATAGPQVTLGAQQWDGLNSAAGPFSYYNGNTNQLRVPNGVTLTTGDHIQTRWCTPHAGTRITAATVRRVRFNGLAAMNMRLQDSAGTDLFTRDVGGMSDDGVYDDGAAFQAPGPCVYGGVYQRATQAMAHGDLLIHNELVSVQLEDLQGPAVSGATAPTWVTGDTASIEWDSSDNTLFRGSTGARVEGGGTIDAGDQANGHHRLAVPVGALPDGTGRRICAYRAAPGWATAEQCTAFNLDRNPPTVPTITLTPDAGGGWTNHDVHVVIGGSSDTGSGVAGYERSENGGAWVPSPATFSVTADAEITYRVRAVDGVGRVSAESPAKTVRVDKTPPVAKIEVEQTGAPGVVRVSKATTRDALSGLKRFEVRLHNAQGTVVADDDAELSNVGAPGTPAYRAGKAKLVLVVYDAAGNTATAATRELDFGSPSGGDAGNRTSPGVVVVDGGAQRIFHTTDLRIPKQRGVRQVDERVVPVVRRDYNGQVVLTGTLRHPDGTPMPVEGLELRDSVGRYVQGRRTDGAGRFRFAVKAGIGNRWTVNLVGQPGARQAVAWFEVKPRVNVRMRMVSLRGRNHLVVTGRLVPAVGSYGKGIQLQWADEAGRWRPAVNARIGEDGAIRLVYGFRKPGGYAIKFRVTAPADNGWPFLAGTSSVFRLVVR